MKTKKLILSVTTFALATLLIAGCGKAANQETSKSSETTATSTKEAVDLNALDLPQLNKEVAEDETLVEMVTSLGSIKLKLFPAEAPKTVENFATHAKDGYYDGLKFHRVINNFMIQGGDPEGTGMGGESIWKEAFEDEFSAKLYNLRGAISMANSGPNTNGSQFFIVQSTEDYSDGLLIDDYPEKIIEAYKNGGTPHLDKKHTVFGQVTEGLDVLDKIASTEVGASDVPTKDVTITSIKVLQEAK